MAVRASTRANKGLNKHLEKLLQEEEEENALSQSTDSATARKRSKRQTFPKVLKEKIVEIVKCLPCGADDSNYNEETDKLGEMIQCDKCDTWQHIGCMTGGGKDETLVDIHPFLTNDKKYYCNRCKPNLYPLLLNSSSGNNNDTKVEEVEEEVEEEELPSADDDSDVYVEEEPVPGPPKNNDDDDEFVEMEDFEKDEPINSSSIKKKSKKRSISTSTKIPTNKKQNKSEPTSTTTTRNVSMTSEEQRSIKIRQNAKKMFIDLFTRYIIPDTTEVQTYTLPPNSTVEEIATQMGESLEKALFESCLDKTTKQLSKNYPEKVRSLFSNLKDKKNLDLKSHVINYSLPMDRLVRMNVNELANPDLQQYKKRRDTKSLNRFTIETDESANSAIIKNPDDFNEEPDEIYSKDNIRRRSISDDDLEKENQNKSETVNDTNNDEDKNRNNNYIQIIKTKETNTENENHNYSIPLKKVEITDPEVFWTTSGYLKFIGDTTELKRSVYNRVISDGNLLIEGRLSSEKGFAYLNEVKNLRNIVTYQLVNPPDSDAIANINAMSDSLLISNKILGITPKMTYEKIIYVIPATGNIIPEIFHSIYGDNTGFTSNIETFDKALFVVFVIKPELIN
ncbi:similar to Saccharomyces cerevisiae YKL005C BYE1 Negative regulator of transcription elongation [Maudiozyma barnettii]|uniref:Transcription factor BYE1 n=1 Tax=Maudiozyma barnettii TaxID=61262 RepID=A0A8H2ZKP0_9SACH|nr:Bye1p [Kazachstania barnettii]CAB4257163.1 similar to Saccharomyces cerevisiae YKL005C BYE1 Negative regulator of transcription elongation [Kazachstania barnettii]CAD1779533.1 similar to Saccharomyces cerevisiae YKL005C BYE1 Negative regulator of transcription elongation [Kazachstania barnettii]